MTNNKMPNVIEAVAESSEQTAIVIWQSVVEQIRGDVSESVYNKWLKDLEFVADLEGVIQVATATGTQADRVNTDFIRKINLLWSERDPSGRRVSVASWADLPEDVRELAEEARAEREARISSDATDVTEPALRTSGKTLSFENLVTSESNRLACTIGRKIADGQATPSQTIYFYGRHGVGKTHLLHAIETEMVRNDDPRTAVYMSAEEFMVAFVEGVKRRDTSDLKTRLRSADVLLIDDLQAIAGMGGTQKEFFSNIRAVVARGGQVVITADESPSQLDSLSARVREELQGGVLIEVAEPDEAMRRRIVEMKAAEIAAENPGFELSSEAVDLIVSRVKGPGRQLYGAVCNVFTATTFIGNPVTLDDVSAAVRRQLGDLKPPTIDQVKRATMTAFDVTKTDLESARRSRSIAYPRQIAMYLCRKMTTRSLPQIGRFFGNRDHTTVLYAVRKLEDAVKSDETLRRDIEKVERAIEDILSSAGK
ncbi:MAG: chromosomal replication initiator protein DnaA [Hyphomonadaceae bacterium TMED5]|nr:chromosomal replication initiator protein DnaA [Ponticaulis sp.]OUY01253.1 MAG: chromosomal replication initiator protein DnaA [Hyphomonadaceae bacterium TMED5]|tara:strand:+ start:2505 stop:3950 length:1446 start_codon:yes stop_codon:yes gene_type:complete